MKAIMVRKPSLALTSVLILIMAVAVMATLSGTIFATDSPNVPTVTITPGGSQPSASRVYTITVANGGSGDAIEQVVIDVPPVGTGGSSFDLTAITDPTGWTCVAASDVFGTRTDTLTCKPDTLGVPTALTEAVDWTDGANAGTAGIALNTAIDGVAGVSAEDDGSGVVTIAADAFGAGGNNIIIESDDATNLALAGGGTLQPLTGGAAGVKASLVVTLTNSGSELDGDILTITVPSAARIRSAAVKASGVLTLTGNAADGETVVIDTKTYTFQTTLTDVDGNVLIAGSASDSIDNLIAAINLDAGSGTTYAASTTVHPTVAASAGSGDTMIAEAKTGGTAANTIATTEGLGNGSWSDTTLNGGVDASIDISLTATAPTLATTYTWKVTSTDVGNDSVLTTGSDDTAVAKNVTTVVETSAPTVTSITVLDRDTDGKIDAATVIFDEAVSDSTFTAADWTIGGVTVESIDTLSSADDATIQLRIDTDANEIASTAVQDVIYTPGTSTDLAANPLAAVLSGDVTEVDDADPHVLTRIITTTTTINITYSEDLDGSTVVPGDYAITSPSKTVSAATESAPASSR